jgi:uncharacterized membrane protein
MSPTQLSRELRLADTPDLSRRRGIVGLSMVGVAAGAIVSLYQTGVIRHLPDIPGKIWNADKVDASDYAYKRARTPDALMMIVSYGATAWLAGAGGKDRAERLPLLPVAMAVKVLNDAAFALTLGKEEWAENKALCWYCQSATLASLASVPLALPEAWKGLKRLFG